MNPFFRIDFSISDSLKTVRKSVLIYETIIIEAGVDIVTIKNILGHVSVQTTQIYAEMSQDSVDRKLKEWNDTWFGSNVKVKEAKTNIPGFLKRK